jgi:hypothetical protein
MSTHKEPFDPVGMKFTPDPSDFEQSDEHAEEYEENQRVVELLRGKFDPQWKKIWKRRKRIGLRLLRIALLIYVLVVPVYCISYTIEEFREGLSIGTVGLGLLLSMAILAGSGLVALGVYGLYNLIKWAFAAIHLEEEYK